MCFRIFLASGNIRYFYYIQGWVKSFAMYMLVCGTYITCLHQFKPWKVPAMVDSIMVATKDKKRDVDM